MILDFMNPHKISAYSDNKQKSYGMLLIKLVTWGVTNRDVLLLVTIQYLICGFFSRACQICLKFCKCINSFGVLMGSDLVFIEPNRQRNYCRLFFLLIHKNISKKTPLLISDRKKNSSGCRIGG